MNKDNFELKLEELEKCCERASQGNLSMDELMEYYVEGRKLHDECLKILDEKKQKFETIKVEE